MAKVLVVDVTDDYRLLQPPLPTEFYPVLAEVWVPRMSLFEGISTMNLVDGYLYDWHESPQEEVGTWVVGVVDQEILALQESQLQTSHLQVSRATSAFRT